MGVHIHIKMYKYNSDTNLYDEIKLYRHRKPNEIYEYYDENGEGIPYKDDYCPIRIFEGQNYEMFDGMKDGSPDDGYGNFPMTKVTLNSFSPEAKATLEKYMGYEGVYDFREISLAEMKLYVITHPTVLDYDSPAWDDDTYSKPFKEKPQKDNPIKGMYRDIFNYIYISEECCMYEPLSHYKVVFYWDC